MATQTVAIVGAGIAGLAAGCYAQMNGYRARIFEMHNQPGGLCTGWRRRGYTFDGCIHHLAGAGPASWVHRVWNELGVFDRHSMHFYEILTQVEMPDGQALTIYTDLDRLEDYLKGLSPQDGPVIDEYLAAARRFLGVDLFASPMGGAARVALLRHMPLVMRWGPITLERFSTRFRHPLLRAAFPTLQYDFPNIPMMLHLVFLAGSHNRTLGWPSGGSLAFARGIAQRFAELGGEIIYGARVERILVRDDRAVGVRLADGHEECADAVISAADGYTTIFHLLEGRYSNRRIEEYYRQAPDGNEMNLCVALGVAREFGPEPHALTLFLEQPIEIGGSLRDRIDVELFGFDPALAPVGKTPLKVLLKASYAGWKSLAADRPRYEETKQRVAETVIALLDRRFAGLRAQLEAVDVSTPVTIERFTGNYHGLQAYPPPGNPLSAMIRGFTRTLPGLGRFRMVGQWAEASIGLSTAAISGRNAIRELCAQDGKRFVTVVV